MSNMHVYFVGIGGTGLGPQALICKQLGWEVSGSDKQDSEYIRYLKSQGIADISIGQESSEAISRVHTHKSIDWVVYSYAVVKENLAHPELAFAEGHGIKHTDRGDLLVHIIQQKNLKLIAIAGTHGKTTTTSMAIWLFKQLGLPVSYSVGAKSSFADMGAYENGSKYFVYECDEYERNFLKFHPFASVISGIDWDHPDTYPTRELYNQAFKHFINQSDHTLIWQEDAEKLALRSSDRITVLNKGGYPQFKLVGKVNRENGAIVSQAISQILGKDITSLAEIMNKFPGLSRRFEKIAENIYSDYAHTPEKIRGALQMAHEVAGDKVVVVYEGLHNTRQHFIKDELKDLFDSVKKLYVVPSYRAREDMSLEDLTPEKLIALTSQSDNAEPARLDENLKAKLTDHATAGDLVLCISAGGGGSLDEWLRKQFK